MIKMGHRPKGNDLEQIIADEKQKNLGQKHQLMTKKLEDAKLSTAKTGKNVANMLSHIHQSRGQLSECISAMKDISEATTVNKNIYYIYLKVLTCLF